MMNTATFATRTEIVAYTGYGLTIHIDEAVWKTWDDSRQVHPSDLESFGVLIGACEKTEKSSTVEEITTPCKRDIRSRSHFILQDPCHQTAVNRAYRRSDGFLGYLGTWHTHPEKHPSPSTVDISDWMVCIERNPDRQLFFVIVGTENTYIFVKQGDQFNRLEK